MLTTTSTERTTAMAVSLLKRDPNYSCYGVMLDDPDLPDDFFDCTIGKGDPALELRTALTHLDEVTAPLVPAGTWRARLTNAGLI